MSTPEFTASESSPPLALPPATPGKYALLAELGRGGMATAYLAAMQGPGGFNKLVVVKRLRPALATEPEFLRMFLQEARLAARIDHPNVVHTTEVGFDGEDYFIAMEYLEGQSLENLSRRVLSRAAGLNIAPPSSTSPTNTVAAGATPTLSSAISVEGAMIPLPIHLFVLTQVLAGLDFAHELKDFDGNPLNVVHRDVSPHNVMVTYDGHVKLVDFGIAKAADSNGDTRTGVMKGKCAYMPAEQFGGKVDRRADVFAVGVMLWQALTGRRLWKGLSDAEVFQRLSRDDIPTPSSVKEGIHPELETICMKALAYRPDDRWTTAADFQSAIEDVIAGDRALRANPRETGKYIAELFAADREKVRRVIEEELGSRSAGATAVNTEGLPVLGLHATSSLPALSSARQSVSASGISGTAASQILPTDPMHVTPDGPRRGRVAGIVAVAAVAAGVIVFALTRGPGPTSAESGTAPVAPPAAASPPAAEAVARVELVTVPATARITVDGAQIDGEPARFERDGKRHLVNVEADGFESRSDWLVFDRERFDLPLTRLDARRTGAARYTPPRPAPATGKQQQKEAPQSKETDTPAVAPPAASTKKGVGLDTGDPWAK